MTKRPQIQTGPAGRARGSRGSDGDACPICRKPATGKALPFCSPRCQKIDLSRWLNGVYAVPGEPVAAAADAGEETDG